jgi:hypothetical protein
LNVFPSKSRRPSVSEASGHWRHIDSATCWRNSFEPPRKQSVSLRGTGQRTRLLSTDRTSTYAIGVAAMAAANCADEDMRPIDLERSQETQYKRAQQLSDLDMTPPCRQRASAICKCAGYFKSCRRLS